MTIDKLISLLEKKRKKYGGNTEVKQLQLVTCMVDDEFVPVAERVLPINKVKYNSKKFVYVDVI